MPFTHNPTPPRGDPSQVCLFATCLTDTFFPRAAVATVRLLRHLGCTVHFPPDQTCCGQGQFNNGLHDDARILARNLIQAFPPDATVVSPSASCVAMIREYYPSLFAHDPAWHTRARDFARRTFEITEFLAHHLQPDWPSLAPRLAARVTYHYSCHSRTLGIEPSLTESLLRAVADLDYHPAHKLDQCCGFGGTFAVKEPAISDALVAEKVAHLAATHPDIIVVNDAGCTLNIAGYCHRNNLNFRFLHVAELLAEALGLIAPDSESVSA